jgi:ribulose-5-phosphate 4-epimerase/fuculose-1-phosphate aldolase
MDNNTTVNQVRNTTASHFVSQSSANDDVEMLKYKLAAAYRIMVTENLDEGGISGHISMRVPGYTDRFWVNPFGKLAEEVTPENLVMVDHAGNVIEGDYPVNVAGFCIHEAIHRMHPEVKCAVHTHSPYGTLFSATGRKIEPLDQNCCMFFENHAIYDRYEGPVNDEDDAQRIAEAINGVDTVILKNHGTITCGTDIESAVMRMVAVERAYRLNILSTNLKNLALVDDETAAMTREWIGNGIGLSIEFNALLRKVERIYPDFKEFKPKPKEAPQTTSIVI